MSRTFRLAGAFLLAWPICVAMFFVGVDIANAHTEVCPMFIGEHIQVFACDDNCPSKCIPAPRRDWHLL